MSRLSSVSERSEIHELRRLSVPAWAVSLAHRVVPPLAMFVLARIAISVCAHLSGHKPYLSATWSRWDSAHYLSIATEGYAFFSCAQLPGYNPSDWCGNAAWLPGYPLLIRLMSAFGPSPEVCGVVISAGFALAGLLLLWNAFLGPEWNTRGLLALALAAFFPGHIYYHAVFPVGMCVFLLLAAIAFYNSRQFGLAGLAGAVAAFTYSSGFFLAAAFGIHLLVTQRKQPLSTQVRAQLQAAGLTVLGFAAVLVLLRVAVGAWDAYQLVQAKYHYRFTFPWVPIGRHLYKSFQPGAHLARQATFVAILIGTLCWAAARKPRRPVDGLLVLFALIYWLTPLMLGPGYVAVIRSEAMLLPAVPLAKKLPTPVLIGLVLIAIILSAQISGQFFRSAIV
jgi:hypothetical protein